MTHATRRRPAPAFLACAAALVLSGAAAPLFAQAPDGDEPGPAAAPLLEEAQRLFYNARYEEAAAAALAARAVDPASLASYEIRTSALLFLVKRALRVDDDDRGRDLEACEECGAIVANFLEDSSQAQKLARARLRADPGDEEARFFLGKIDLNYVWLYLGALGKKKGWNEYWEARRSLDEVLDRNPDHVRARIARAWIDYIVATRVPRGVRWLLGGGNRKKALEEVRAAAGAEADFFTGTEAAFALWEMCVREKRMEEARNVAATLARDFPENRELARFLASAN